MAEPSTDQIEIPGADPLDRDDAPSERAARWVAYLYSGCVTQDGREAFAEWLRDDKNRNAYQAAERWWRDVDCFAHLDCVDEQLQEPIHRPVMVNEGRTGRPGWRLPAAALAAALVAAIGIGGFLTRPTVDTPDFAAHYASAIGKLRTIGLPDGTKVTLSGRTSVVARFSRSSREIRLADGQAFFQVAHDKARPFTVMVGNNRVQDIGTEFDIWNKAGKLRVSVTHGLVTVQHRLAKQDKARYLHAGQQIETAADGAMGDVHPFDVNQVLSWRAGRLSYVDAPLADVVADVNRYSPVPISLNGRGLGDKRVTLSVPIDQTDSLLTGLEMMGEVRISRSADKVSISPR